MDSDLIDHETMPMNNSKLMSEPLLAQLATVLPKELFLSKLQKLYVGRESGFSMRSLQSKCFNWEAPSILLVSGMLISDDLQYAKEKNPRYGKFLEQYPKLKEEQQHLDACHSQRKKATFAVYIDDPWRVTNKEFFGSMNSMIIQLAPRQDVFHASKPNMIYFNTVGGGIGFGNKQPLISNAHKKYIPGNVSLTIDSTLEFAVFRHIGYGGAFKPSALLTKRGKEDESFEIKFIIQDVEVWGCGGEKELQEQIKKLEWEEAEAKRRQHINLKSLGEDRALLEMAGLVGQSQSGGSM